MKKNYLKKASLLSSRVLLLIVIVFSGFNTIEAQNPIEDCENPLAPALGYNAFVRNGVTLNGGDTEGPIALGGDLSIEGIITVAAQTAGDNFFNGDDSPSSLVVNGRVFYNSGEGLHLNQGYAKVGDLEGSSVFDLDPNNAVSNTRITPSSYEATPRIQVQRNQAENSVGQSNLIDFEGAFQEFIDRSQEYSILNANVTLTADNKITLIENEINVLNLAGSTLESLPFLTFENLPSQNTPLIINVDAPGDFDWSVLDIAGIGDQEGAFILWNFYNSSTITLTGGSTIVGTLFAPTSYVVKDSSGNINGQVIADSYYHVQGELHQHIFDGCTDDETDGNDGTGNRVCTLDVNVGDDQEICPGEEVTLTAEARGNSTCEDCSGIFDIENTTLCTNTNREYVLFLASTNGNRWFSNVDLQWNELADGSATLTGTVIEDSSSVTLVVNAIFSGRTDTPPVDSPKEHRCNDEDSNDWTYFTEISGTISTVNGSRVADLSRRGSAFQLGNGANETEEEFGRFGASGWFNTTDDEFFRGDFNINIGDCISSTTSTELSYLWSTGETTPSITVSPEEDTTYTVTVTGCNGCATEDEVSVFVNTPSANAGEDQDICLGESTTLTVEGEGDILWSTGETTASIEVSPSETTTYFATITNGECEATDEVIVNVGDLIINIDPADEIVICFLDELTLTASEADSYLWSTGETTQSIVVSPFEDTTYSVIGTRGTCESTDEVLVIIDFCNIGEAVDFELNFGFLYPNVISKSDTFHMDVSTDKNQDQISLAIYNTSGNLLTNDITRNIVRGENTLDFNLGHISGLSSGIYFVTITNSEKVIRTEKIIIR